MALRMNKDKAQKAIDTKSDDNRYGGGSTEYWNLMYCVPYHKYKPIEGDNVIDMIPYLVTNPKNPSVITGESIIGDDDSSLEAYLDIGVHQKMGEKEIPFLCTEYMDNCPICKRKWSNYKHVKGMKDTNNAQYKKDFLGGYNSSRRFIMYVIPRKGEQKNQICWADFPLKGSGWGEKLLDRASYFERKNNELVDYVSCGKEGVKSITFEAEKVKGQNWLEFKNFDFEDRKVEVTEETIRSMPDPMDFIVLPTNTEINDYMGESPYDEMIFTCNPEKLGKVPQSYLTAKNGVTSNDMEDYKEDEEDEEEVPDLTPKTDKKPPVVEDVDDEDDDDDDDDEETPCVAGRKFGEYNTPEKCTAECPYRRLCRKESRMKG